MVIFLVIIVVEAGYPVKIQHSDSETARPGIRQNVIWTKGHLD